MKSTALSTGIDNLLSQLTLEEEISLLAAADWWRTPVINRDRLFVPHIKSTDGPNGARGESYVSGIKAACFPCGTSLGATFDTSLVAEVGEEIAREAITKSANILLAPTLNVIRSPLGGRNYETYSEDPLVLGKLAAAFVTGCQSQGIAATPKHFVANEAENQRTTLSVEVDEQSLREIYLLPFQYVLKYSDPWCFMTSYNKINGTYVSDDKRLIEDVLRKEWGFKGLVVSDWMGVYSTVDAILAGVDLEMPGPTKFRGKLLLEAVEDGRVPESAIHACSRRVLELAEKLRRFDQPSEAPERAVKNEHRDNFIAQTGAEGMVLLKNDNLLPIARETKVALIGHHAMTASLGGGGSARVDSLHAVSPFDGLQDAHFDVRLSTGIPVFGALPHADPSLVLETQRGAASPTPVKVEWFHGSTIGENLAFQEMRPLAEYMIKEKWPSYLTKDYCTRMTFDLRPKVSGSHTFSVICTGRAICRIDQNVVFVREQETDLKPESFYFFKSKLERRFQIPMVAQQTYTVVLESWATADEILKSPKLNDRIFQGSALRFHEEIDVAARLAEAAALAARSEVAIVCVGTTNEIESEGFDRDNMELSNHQYELVEAVFAANPKTCVVNFSGGPVNFLPFVERVPAIVQAWFPGQECGRSLAKILSGEVNPCGKLPFSWPRRVEDSSSHGNFPAHDSLLRYEEGLNVGYRWHDRPGAPDPLFPFGHGLSYTSFTIGNIASSSVMRNGEVSVSFMVSNTGPRSGATVVQIYVQAPPGAPGQPRPVKELKEFAKVNVDSDQCVSTSITLDKYAVSVYDSETACWQARSGRYCILVGTSVADIHGIVEFEVPEGFEWTGI